MLANNSFVKAAISVNGGEWKKAVLKVYDGNVYLLSHTRRIFGVLPDGMSKHGMLGGAGFLPASVIESWDVLDGRIYIVCGQHVKITLEAATAAAHTSALAVADPELAAHFAAHIAAGCAAACAMLLAMRELADKLIK